MVDEWPPFPRIGNVGVIQQRGRLGIGDPAVDQCQKMIFFYRYADAVGRI